MSTPTAFAAHPAELADGALVARCREGDQRAWDEFVERFSRYVYAICTRGYRIANADAEDVFQEVFARAYERIDGLRSDEAVRPWIAQITRRLCIDRLRGAGREQPADLFEQAELDATIQGLDAAMAVRQAMAQLPAQCQEVLDRFFCRDQTYQVIGEALQIPPGTIASRISRCLARLRGILEQEE